MNVADPVAEVHDGAVLDRFSAAYDAKYAFRPEPDPAAPGVYALRPDVVLAWRETDFPRSATRFRFDAATQ